MEAYRNSQSKNSIAKTTTEEVQIEGEVNAGVNDFAK
jgi:hypothetical protein